MVPHIVIAAAYRLIDVNHLRRGIQKYGNAVAREAHENRGISSRNDSGKCRISDRNSSQKGIFGLQLKCEREASHWASQIRQVLGYAYGEIVSGSTLEGKVCVGNQ